MMGKPRELPIPPEAAKATNGFEIARIWMGAEGESAALLEENGPVFRVVLTGYRYWAPL